MEEAPQRFATETVETTPRTSGLRNLGRKK